VRSENWELKKDKQHYQFSILIFQLKAGSDSFGNFSILNSHFTSHFQSAEYIFYPIDLILCFMRKKNKSKTGFKPVQPCFMREKRKTKVKRVSNPLCSVL